jgi:F0F1-type ATP synthase assembly protein I
MAQNKKKPKISDVQNAFRAAAPFLNIAYVIIGGVLFFGYVGYYLDSKLNTSPFLLIVGVFWGFALGLYDMFKVLKKFDRK